MTSTLRVPIRCANRRRGMSLVELMVGITVGLFVVAAATTLMANQLSDNRRLLVETQVQQDLRATMDIITRQLRRAGAANILEAQAGMTTSTGAAGTRMNYTTILPAAGTEVGFSFRRSVGDAGPYGFKLEANTIKTFVSGSVSPWPELTDSNVLKVTAFSVTPTVVASAVLPCPKLCADGTATCWPQLVVRDYEITIEAQAKNDATVRRTMSSRVRLRNDWVRFNDAANPNAVCPS